MSTVRASHLLVKHKDSRRPSSWKVRWAEARGAAGPHKDSTLGGGVLLHSRQLAESSSSWLAKCMQGKGRRFSCFAYKLRGPAVGNSGDTQMGGGEGGGGGTRGPRFVLHMGE